MKIELNRNGELCPACGEGHLASHVTKEQVEHQGIHGEVDLHYSVCQQCGSELAGQAEAQANKRAMVAFRKKAEGLLTGSEIRELRKSFDLTQILAAELFGGGKIGFSRYENDDITQSAAMDSLLRLCAANNSNLLLLAVQKKLDLPETFVAKIKAKYFLEQINNMGKAIQCQLDHNRAKAKLDRDFSSGYRHDIVAANSDKYMCDSRQRVAKVSEIQAWKTA
ncbi:MAG TPA: type II toxin-antitoxin system MqsA family antitoxin [Nitrosospira sp.]|nr:type II toxin-antitoxin system MqsA family antitoxin [Nitrosospira sp.]